MNNLDFSAYQIRGKTESKDLEFSQPCAKGRTGNGENKIMSKSGSRKSNGSGYTYKNGKSFRTVIVDKGRTITASGPTAAASRRNAQAKLLALPIIAGGSVARCGNITLGQFLISWLENEHKKKIAETTYWRYHGLATRYIIPA